jgi:hypothetical protein
VFPARRRDLRGDYFAARIPFVSTFAAIAAR